jgi:serine/threonine protein kinase
VRRKVALKVIKLGMDTKSVIARFEAERQALAMMDHPNIAKFFDAGVTGSNADFPVGKKAVQASQSGTREAYRAGWKTGVTGRPYFVMELVRGIKITDYCDQKKLSTRERLDLFIKVCQAVQHAHQKGIIHHDLKPSNILVALHDGVPVPKVIDFGIAKATEGRLTSKTVYTELHQFIGTPAYMSPEQPGMSGLDIDTRSDIYSLGVLLYELLTSKTPFDANELVARKVLGDDPELAMVLDNLARILAAQGKYDQAEPLQREAVAIRRNKLGHQHLLLAGSLNQLGEALNKQASSPRPKTGCAKRWPWRTNFPATMT